MKHPWIFAVSVPGAIVGLALAGCGGVNADVSLGDGGTTGAISEGIAESGATFVVLDLGTGSRRTAMSLPDLESNAAYRTTAMVFRRVTGSGGDFMLGVFEVTQRQWQLIAPATTPSWTLVDAAVAGSAAVGDTRPAFNLSVDDATTGLASYNAGRPVQLAIPSDAQWAHACAAGGQGTWSWGDDRDRTTVESHAMVAETATGTGPAVVGSLAANPWGFHDMHGNVWEWTMTDGAVHMRGGSWRDSVILARTALQVDADAGISRASRHALVGLRLVMRQ